MNYISNNVQSSDVEYQFGSRYYKKYINEEGVEDICIITTQGNLAQIEDETEKKKVQEFIDKERDNTISNYCIDRLYPIDKENYTIKECEIIGYFIDKDDYNDNIYALFKVKDLRENKNFRMYNIPCSTYSRKDVEVIVDIDAEPYIMPEEKYNLEEARNFMKNQWIIEKRSI